MKTRRYSLILFAVVLFTVLMCVYNSAPKKIDIIFNENIVNPDEYRMYEDIISKGYKIRTVFYGQDSDWDRPKTDERYEFEFEVVPTWFRRLPSKIEKYNVTVNGNKPEKLYFDRAADLSTSFNPIIKRKVLVVKYSFYLSSDKNKEEHLKKNYPAIDKSFTWNDYLNILNDKNIPDYSGNICDYFNTYYGMTIDSELDFSVSSGSNDLFDYTIYKNNKAIITKYKGNSSEVVIPNKIDGHDVVGITASLADQDSLLMTDFKIKKVEIQEGIQFIGREVFIRCVFMNEVVLPESLMGIDNEAFAYCYSLKKINLSGSLKCIDTGAFYKCHKMILKSIPDSVDYIAPFAFDSCNSIKELHLSENITRLYGHTFSNCKNLSKIYKPKSLKKFYNSDFAGTRIDFKQLEKEDA